MLSLAVACGDDGGGDEGGATFGPVMTMGGSGSATAAMTMTSSEPGTTAGTSAAETGPVGTEGEGSSGDSQGPSTSPPADGSSEGGGGLCEGAQANACLDCAVPPCCQAWTACQADEGCTCVVDCHVVGGSSLGSCESQCNSDGELYQALFFCGQQSCLGACEWDCC